MPPRASKVKNESEPTGFEPMLRELERTVASLESGELGLDDALVAYERGVGLLGRCKGLLDAADRKVALLTGVDESGTPQVAPFDGEVPVAPAPEPAPAPEADDTARVIPRPPWEDDDGAV